MKGKTKTIRLRADEVRIHPVAQKDIIAVILRRIRENMDLDAIGAIDVVRYEIGGVTAYWVVDGQHRVRALLDLGLGEWVLDAIYHVDVKDDARACDLFLKLNDRGSVGTWAKWENKLRRGDPVIVRANEVCISLGFTPSKQAGDGRIVCMAEVEKACELDMGASLATALGCLSTAFGHTAAAVEGKLVGGATLVVAKMNGNHDLASLTKKLAKFPSGACGIVGAAKTRKTFSPGRTLAPCVGDVIRDIYNKGRQKNFLDPL